MRLLCYLPPTVPSFSVSLSDSIQRAMIGSPLAIQCTIDTDGMDLGTVMISWMGPGGDTITSGSRVTISGTTGLMSTLNFMYLMEEDEGTYTCSVITSSGSSGLGTVEIMTLAGKSL